jgi:hypothetical protein
MPGFIGRQSFRKGEELARVALWLAGVGISEAAVERTFSWQKFVETPLRSRLADANMQASLFVRFNFTTFGDPGPSDFKGNLGFSVVYLFSNFAFQFSIRNLSAISFPRRWWFFF